MDDVACSFPLEVRLALGHSFPWRKQTYFKAVQSCFPWRKQTYFKPAKSSFPWRTQTYFKLVQSCFPWRKQTYFKAVQSWGRSSTSKWSLLFHSQGEQESGQKEGNWKRVVEKERESRREIEREGGRERVLFLYSPVVALNTKMLRTAGSLLIAISEPKEISVWLPLCLSDCLPKCLSVCLSVCLPVFLSVQSLPCYWKVAELNSHLNHTPPYRAPEVTYWLVGIVYCFARATMFVAYFQS